MQSEDNAATAQPGRLRRWTGTLRGSRDELALATLAGVMVFLSFPTFDIMPLAFVCMAPLILASERVRPLGAFFLGWLAGLVTNLGGFYWITNLLRDFGGFPFWAYAACYVAICLQQGLVLGVFAGLGRWLRFRAGFGYVAAYVPAIILAEAVTPMIFKWYLGNSQYTNLYLAQSAELGGVMMISAALVATSAGVIELNRWRGVGRPPIAAVTALTVVAAVHAWGAVRVVQIQNQIDAAPTLRVGMVEANIGIFEKAERALVLDNLLIHQRLSAMAVDEGAELIVWPETAYGNGRAFASRDPVGDGASVDDARRRARVHGMLPHDATWLPPSRAPLVATFGDDTAARTPIADQVPPHRGFRAPLLTGTLTFRELTEDERAALPPIGGRPREVQITNSAILLSEDGRVLGMYDKNVLMPFSEQVPFADVLYRRWGINLLDIVPQAGAFYQGSITAPLELPRPDGEGVFRLAVMICYEDIMPQIGREMNAYLPDAIVNVTNDAWFGETSEPYLHLALATFRTIEQRTSMIRSTNTGVSAFIDPLGRITSQTSLNEAEILVEDVAMLRARRTLYMRFGNWLVWPAICAWFVGGLVARRRTVSNLHDR